MILDLLQPSIQISGAGSEEANGIYKYVTQNDFPSNAPIYTSELLWQKEENPNLGIVHTDDCWWIADYRDATADYYIINDGDPNIVPLGLDWIPCSEDDDGSWHIGVAPRPVVEWKKSHLM